MLDVFHPFSNRERNCCYFYYSNKWLNLEQSDLKCHSSVCAPRILDLLPYFCTLAHSVLLPFFAFFSVILQESRCALMGLSALLKLCRTAFLLTRDEDYLLH